MQNIPIPYISLVVPTHNRSRLLRRALDSVNSQSIRKDIEVIVVSDCACADTDFVCHELLQPGDVYISNIGRPGPSASRNLALKLASGQHIMFLDDDDSWHPDFSKNLFNLLPHHNYPITYMNSLVIKESRLPTGPIFLSQHIFDIKDILDINVFLKNQIHMSSFLFSSHVISGLKFDNHMRAYEDWDLQLFAIERYFPNHIPILSTCIYEVDDETSDCRGESKNAKDFNAVMDYLYVYRRHPSPTTEIAKKKKSC
jgi:glycosyltransferase involved in cell wall biosynthesis